MVEVFKTNVQELSQANMLLGEIHKTFAGCQANFDLDDCDKILRIKSVSGLIHPPLIIHLLKEFGFDASVLPDEIYLVPGAAAQRVY